MRNQTHEGLDTFRVERIPKDGSPELRFRAYPLRTRLADYLVTTWLVGGSLFVTLAVVCLRLADFMADTRVIGFIALMSCALALYLFAMSESPKPWWKLALAPGIYVCIWLLAKVPYPMAAFLLFSALAGIAMAWLAKRMACFTIELLAVDLPRQEEQEVLETWHQKSSQALQERGIGLIFSFSVGLVGLALATFQGWNFLGTPLAVLAFLVALGVCAYLQLPQGDYSISNNGSLLWDMLREWFTYSTHYFAPGMLRPEIGSLGELNPMSRKLLLLGCLGLAAMALLPTANYFPFIYRASEGWQTLLVPPDVERPSETEIQAAFTPAQAETFAHLGSRKKQTEYLAALTTIEYETRFQAALHELRSDVEGQLGESPERWITAAIAGLPVDPTGSTFSLLFSVVLSAVTPLFVFCCVITTLYAPAVAETIKEIGQRIVAEDASEFNQWERYATTMLNSADPTERESLYLGVHETGRYPVMLHRSILHEHAHILGDSGSGKTALGLSPMMTQLIRMAGRDAKDKDAVKQRSSCVILDLKGDQALFHAARLEAEAAGLPFKWFTNQSKRTTYSFNPLLQSHTNSLTPNQRAEELLESLGLAYGEGYGRGHFSTKNKQVLSRIMAAFEGEIHSFADLQTFGEKGKRDLLGRKLGITKKEREDAGDVFAVIENLAMFEALNVTESSIRTEKRAYGNEVVENAIDFGEVLRTPQVVYFYLPASIESARVRQVGKLALFSLMNAALQSETEALDQNQVYLIVDEFQQIVSENLEIVLRQARSKRIACILANQTISDLRTPAVDLIPTVQANTRFKQFFATTDLMQQEQLMKASGETIQTIYSWSEQTYDPEPRAPSLGQDVWTNPAEAYRVQIGPRLSRNDLITLSDHELLSVVHIPRGKGYSQFGGYPFVVESEFHITEEEYTKRNRMEWPTVEKAPGSFLPGVATPETTSIPAKNQSSQPNEQESQPDKAPPVESNQSRLAKLLAQQQSFGAGLDQETDKETEEDA